MFKTVEQLKEFIIWAKDQKVQEVHVGKVVVVFSALALTESLYNEPEHYDTQKPQTEERDTSKTLVDDEPEAADNEDDLLYYSSRP